jgi:hypothetical protein
METPPHAQAFDAARLIADLRKGDPEAIERAYRATFASDLGRLVLAHHLSACGVGNAFGPHLSDAELRYQVGRHDAAIDLASRALIDQSSIVGEILSESLQGATDDAHANHPPDEMAYIPPDDDF